MKTSFTFKNQVTPRLLFLSSLVFLFSANVFGSVKHTVNVSNYKFTPNELQIEVGDTVEWKNTLGFHNVNGTKTTFPTNPESFGNATGSGWTYKFVFKIAGKYDYHCDPHASDGMTGKIEVKDSVGNDDGKYDLTVNFTGMTPHVGQNIWLSLIDKDSGIEIERKKQIGSVSFAVVFSGIEKDHSYNVDFFADHNKNGQYDAPPADHAWRLDLNNARGDTTLNFQHNTSFTDIMWKNKLTVHFMGMTPHVGQNLQLAVIEKTSGMEVQRVSVTAAVDFMVDVFGIENGKSYNVDFFADHNKNGQYDVPPADHAWRMELNNVKGDTTLNFQHNTSFTNINWISTAISEQNNSLLKMYPNPATDKVFIEMDKISGSEIQVSIYDLTGKLKYSALKPISNRLELDIQNLSNGIYFIELNSNNEKSMFKLLKQ